MSLRLSVALLYLVVATASPFAYGYAECAKTKEIREKCKSDGDKVITQYQSELSIAKNQNQSDMNGMSGAMTLAASRCAGGIAAAAAACKKKESECSSCAKSNQEGTCKKAVAGAVAALDAQKGSCAGNALEAGATNAATDAGAPPGDNAAGGTTPPPAGGQQGGGSDSLMPMLMGAGMGALAGMMLGKDDKDKKKDEEEKPEDETSRTPADCTIAAGANDSRCNAELESKCAMTPELEICSLFVARYCAEKPATSPPNTGSDNVTPASTDGEGSGKPFCLAEKTKTFCKETGRASCLSCIELSRPKPGNCQTDPASCAPQYSQAEIDSAKVACPVDPKFADPAFAASMSGSGGPAVMLPSSLGRSPASDIAPQYGKSVFSISSVTMKKMCDENRLNNCPKN